MNVKLLAIAALGKNRQIGLNKGLPWKIPEEYQHFQRTVKGEYVIVGRKNYESHRSDVEGTIPLILTRNPNYRVKKGHVFHDLPSILVWARNQNIKRIYVIGGEEIYGLTLPYLSEFLWSEVDYDGAADAWFPDFLSYPWKTLSEEKHPQWTFRRLVKAPESI